MTSSVSLFPLTYLGYSVIQRSNDCELETIYELLMEYYLQFLENVTVQPSCLTPFKNSMSKLYETVVLAVGNGNFTIRSLSMNPNRVFKPDNRVEEKFSAQELLYFNCYYLEVVTPVGRDKETCYAYFRRVIDTRRCVPEEALIQLNRNMSSWLLRHRCLMRPPLIYCIVPRAKSICSLACFVFLAETTQIGLKIIRCFSELRYSTNVDRNISQEKFEDPVNISSMIGNSPTEIKRHIGYPISGQIDNHNLIKMHHGDQRRTYFDDTHCHLQPDCGRPCLSARAARSHNDLIMAFDQFNLDNYGHCNTSCEFLTHSVNPCPIHTKCSEKHRARLLQMRLGHEALDFYRQRQRVSSADRVAKRYLVRDPSVPDSVRHDYLPYSNEYLTQCYPECKANARKSCKTYSPHRISKHVKIQPQQQQHHHQQQQRKHQYQSETNELCKTCSSNDHLNLRDIREKCHCHAHLGGSLELIP